MYKSIFQRHTSPNIHEEQPPQPFFVKADSAVANAHGSVFFQTKPVVEKGKDPYEEEANTVADKIVQGMDNSGVQNASPVQLKCADCASAESTPEDQEEKLQKKENAAPVKSAVQTPSLESSLQ